MDIYYSKKTKKWGKTIWTKKRLLRSMIKELQDVIKVLSKFYQAFLERNRKLTSDKRRLTTIAVMVADAQNILFSYQLSLDAAIKSHQDYLELKLYKRRLQQAIPQSNKKAKKSRM